jgi:hypothetical protein
MIPLRNEVGLAIALISRRHPDMHDENIPKYLNSPDTDVFTKGQILAGLAEGRIHRALVNRLSAGRSGFWHRLGLAAEYRHARSDHARGASIHG